MVSQTGDDSASPSCYNRGHFVLGIFLADQAPSFYLDKRVGQKRGPHASVSSIRRFQQESPAVPEKSSKPVAGEIFGNFLGSQNKFPLLWRECHFVSHYR